MSVFGDLVAAAAPAVGSYFGGPVGAAAGSAYANYYGTQQTNELNAARADAANAWSAQQYATRYQTMTKDLIAAGLNPMLAYSQSAGSAPVAQQVTFQNPIASATQAYKDIRGTDVSVQQAETSAKQADIQSRLVDASVEKLKKETRNLDDEQVRLKAAYINLAEQSALLAQQGTTEVVKRKVMEATAAKYVTENLITRAEYDAMVKTGFIGVAAREVKVMSDISSEWVDKLLPWKSKTTFEHGTNYDKHGNPSGGYSRSRTSK